ncbi:SHOCT domain-containing protein [Streptacidiphilus sp. MAP12-20]|uniref:SHOCT domain-containing protein n=1 Tax=Streptacidiphilus sp. MAP12-20 TaxID=3156299 RepID=UPI00351241F9
MPTFGAVTGTAPSSPLDGWLFLLFRILGDIFRSQDMGGFAKAMWILFVILVPFLGVLVYVIVRGHSMGQRDVEQDQKQEQALRAYVRDAAATDQQNAGGGSSVDELARLAELRDKGALNEEEFQQAKTKLLAA